MVSQFGRPIPIFEFLSRLKASLKHLRFRPRVVTKAPNAFSKAEGGETVL